MQEGKRTMADCPHCEYNKKRAQNWRVEAYRLAGHPLPEPEQKIETLKRCLFQMQEAAKDLIQQAKNLPQQRTWLDLTDEEMLMIYGQQHEGKKYSLGRMVQQALKEKNT